MYTDLNMCYSKVDMRKGRKRLAVDVPEKVHTEIKEVAAVYNCTVTQLVIRLLVRLIKEYKGE